MEAGGSFEDYLRERGGYVDELLRRYLVTRASDDFLARLLGKPSYKYDTEAITKTIFEPTWYLLGSGGKRWRPVLMLLVMEALGKNPNDFAEFAIIPELVHNATLIHDDIEDGSPKRRGIDAVHVKYGEDVAINVGDYLYFFPILALLDSGKLTTRTKNAVLSIYLREMVRVCTGQSIDIAWHRSLIDPLSITEDNYMQMVYDKSGVLPRMACSLAAALCGANKRAVSAMGHFGATIGVAFQIQDDVLNIYESDLSKNKGMVGDDITEGKITLLVIHAMQKSGESDRKRLLEILGSHTRDPAVIRDAIDIIDRSGAKEFAAKTENKIVTDAWARVDRLLQESPAKDRLKQLTQFLINRTV